MMEVERTTKRAAKTKIQLGKVVVSRSVECASAGCECHLLGVWLANAEPEPEPCLRRYTRKKEGTCRV